MTSLLQRCVAASTQITQLEVARRNANARAVIQERLKEWNQHLDKLRAAREKASWMDILEAECESVASRFAGLQANAQEALSRLAAGEDVSSLTADALWTRLLQSASGSVEALDEVVTAGWLAFVEAQGTPALPSDLVSQLAPTPTNQQALAAYREAHANYAKLANQRGPRSAQDKDSLLQAVVRCRATLVKMEHDVPPEVQAFFRAVHNNQATLATLTPAVLLWLRDNGQLERYSVRSVAR